MTLAAATAQAAEVTFICSNALKAVMGEIAPRFEQATGHRLAISFGSTKPLKARIVAGEPFDLTLLGEAALDDLIKQGRLDAATRVVIARSALGVAIIKGAAKPDISTPEAFKHAMLGANTIAYLPDGLTGTYLNALFQRLGIADAMRPKYRNARGAEAVAKGEVELGVTQVSEILYQTRTDLVGPLPPGIQNYTSFPAAVSVAAKQPAAAKALLEYLASPDAAQVLRAHGLQPPG